MIFSFFKVSILFPSFHSDPFLRSHAQEQEREERRDGQNDVHHNHNGLRGAVSSLVQTVQNVHEKSQVTGRRYKSRRPREHSDFGTEFSLSLSVSLLYLLMPHCRPA